MAKKVGGSKKAGAGKKAPVAVGAGKKAQTAFEEKFIGGVVVHKSRIDSASGALTTKGIMKEVERNYLEALPSVSDKVSIMIEVRLVSPKVKAAEPVSRQAEEPVEEAVPVVDPFEGVDVG